VSKDNRTSRPILLVAALAVLGAAIGWWVLRPGPAAPPPGDQPAATEPAAQAASEDAELRPQSAAERANLPQLPAVLQSGNRPIPAGAAAAQAPAWPEPTPYARQLVSSLTKLDLSHGPITKEQAEQWKQGLQTLVGQGAAALPAIHEFLAQNQEVNFGAVAGAEQLGQSSLRSAMINALGQIGGPDAQSLMVQTLQATTLPSEVAQLAQYLEQQAPGQFRQETMNAINEILTMSQKGQLPADWDVGALFQTLQKFGDPASASMLEQLPSQWKYYATLSMAGMEAGSGIPTLVQQTRDATAGGQRDFAFQLLAQTAAQYPDAAAALLEAARANQISDATWLKIVTGLAGDQYQIGSPPTPGGANAPPIPGLKTYHIASGNQNFYSLPLAGDASVQERVALMDQLLSATSNPNAIAAIQSARATLSAFLPK